MKKLFFVAVIVAAMVSCTESSTTVVNQDSINAANLADSLAKVAAATPTLDSTVKVIDSTMKAVDSTVKADKK